MNFTGQNLIMGRAMSIDEQISLEDGAGSGRVQIWKMTIDAIQDNPILGTGPENLKEHFFTTENTEFLAYQKRTGKTVDKAHSEILHIAAVSGIPAAIIFILFLATLFWKKRRIIFNFNSSTILAMCIAVYFLQSLFNISIITVAPLFWVLLGVFSRPNPLNLHEYYSNKVTPSPS